VFRAHADRLSYKTTAAFNYRDLYCWRHSIRQAGNVLLVEVVIPETHGWVRRHPLGHHDAVFTGSRERTESEYQGLLHRTGLTLLKTTPLPQNSAFSRPHLPKTDSANGFPERNWPGPAALDCRSPYAGPLIAGSAGRAGLADGGDVRASGGH